MKYKKPKITEKKCKISFFLSNNFFSDALGFFVGDVVYADSQTSITESNGWGGCNGGCTSDPSTQDAQTSST